MLGRKLLLVTALSTGFLATGVARSDETTPPVAAEAAPPPPPAPAKKHKRKRVARVVPAAESAIPVGREACLVGNTKGPKYDAACLARLGTSS